MAKRVRLSAGENIIIVLLPAAALYLYGNARLIAAVLCCVGLAVGQTLPGRRCRLEQRVSLGTLALLGYTILYAVSCLWGPFGTQGLPNAASLMIGSAGYLLLLGFGEDRMLRRLPEMLSTGCGVIALLSLDVSTAQLLTPWLLKPVLTVLGGPGWEEMQYETGTRIVGVVGGANVLAGLLGIGTFLSLHGFLCAEGRRSRRLAILLLLNATVFFLAFSMGALLSIFLAAATYLIFSPQGDRGRVFWHMAGTAVMVLLCAAIMAPGLGSGRSITGVVSLLCPLVIGWLYGMIRDFVFAKKRALKGGLSPKKRRTVTAGAAAALIAYGVLALTISAPLTLTPWAEERDARLAPGTYTLTLQADAPVKLIIASQSRDELLDGVYTYLYNGTTKSASFTVPEGAGIVRFSFQGSGKLYCAAYSGTGRGSLRLNLPLVPSFAANRLRGIYFSKNVLQRVEMCRDGLKLFASSPLAGCGAGAFEAKACSVQQHYYETKYVHNQYIQCLVDTGLLGLLLFLTVLISAFRQLFRQRASNPPLAAALLACLVMASVHGLTEVVWSMHAYLLFLLALLALCERAFPAPLKAARLRSAAARGYTLAILGFCAAVLLHLYAQNEYSHPPETGLTAQRVETLCAVEPFSRQLYQLDYVCNYGPDAEKSAEYLDSLRRRKSYDVNLLLLQYVYLPAWDEKNIRSAARDAYWDRPCDKKAVETLYQLLASCGADQLFSEKGG